MIKWIFYMKFLIVLIVINKINTMNWFKHPKSPCPRMFQYVRLSRETDWFGLLSWHYKQPFDDIKNEEHIYITFSLDERPYLSNYLGEVKLLDKSQRLYKITFPVSYYLPKLLEVRVNDKVICKDLNMDTLVKPYLYTLEYTEHLHESVDQETVDDYIDYIPNEYDEHNSKEMENTNNTTNNNDFIDEYDDVLSLAKFSCGIVHNTKRLQVLKSLKRQISSKYFTTGQSYNCSTLSKTKMNYNINYDNQIYYKAGDDLLAVSQKEESEKDILSFDLNEILFDRPFNEMRRGSWPWMVAIYTHNKTSLIYQCSGTLVTNRHILTSASCVFSLNSREILIFLGRYNLKNWDERGSVAFPVNNITILSDYNRNSIQRPATNIAIIRLKLEVTFNKYIQPACLDYNNKYLDNPGNNLGVLLNWMIGTQRPGRTKAVPKIIGAVMSKVTPCNMDKSNLTFCAKDILLPGRFHARDTGAGLLVYINRRWFLKGILTDTSNTCNKIYALKNADFKQEALFIDVNKYLEWISANIETME